ncbi:hypothetical protein [Anaeromyxobacter sp. PSR-1]|uniref:hypothetical protein n=1 Tax=unclassified Anaeromyxobacter TaxID=2620896 RepID=UPI0005DD8B66|nr:hypothetical protein [Anaeromyxobacter sp. PSR-1]GAO03702.1 hypothetical protein PSR1_02586 [Anaeromyxobacter sp. PSR-1]
MKKALAVVVAVVQLAMCLVALSGVARADETKMVGVITKIDLAGKDAKTATVVLKDVKTEELVEIVVEDDLTLDKFKDHRIVDGDEIRCKYEVKDGKKLSTYFRKTAGC